MVAPKEQAPQKPKGAKKKEKKEAEAEAAKEAELAKKDQAQKKRKKKKHTKETEAEEETEKPQASGSRRPALPGPSLPLDSHPEEVKKYMKKWNMIPEQGDGRDGLEAAGAEETEAEEKKPARKRKARLSEEEKEEIKKARSRKCVAYAKARREALVSGCTDEEAKKKAHEAGSGLKQHNL